MSAYRRGNGYSHEVDTNPFVIASREQTSDYISILFENNCKLLHHYGLTLASQIELFYLGTGLKLNQFTLGRLKHKHHKDCSFRLLGYISKFWSLPLSILLNKDFEPEQVKGLVVFPSFVVLPVKKIKRVKSIKVKPISFPPQK